MFPLGQTPDYDDSSYSASALWDPDLTDGWSKLTRYDKRIKGWLDRIAKGQIPLPYADMDKTVPVPIARWLCDNLDNCQREWPDEREARLKWEQDEVLLTAKKLEEEAARLRAKAAELKTKTTQEGSRK